MASSLWINFNIQYYTDQRSNMCFFAVDKEKGSPLKVLMKKFFIAILIILSLIAVGSVFIKYK